MAESQLSSKFLFILHADVVGSTALVQQNEKISHQRIQAAFRDFAQIIASYGGIADEVRGDALVAEFEKASDAVCAALAFQAVNVEHNKGLSDDIRPELRIGIGMGEVVVADHTITGAGVVLAQRLEQLAEPNGIVVQGAVQEAVPSRLPMKYKDLGEKELKGFRAPVKAHSVSLIAGESIPPPEMPRGLFLSKSSLRKRHTWVVTSALLMLALSLVLFLWRPWHGPVSIRSAENLMTPLPETESVTPGRWENESDVSIAVLPFQNLSNDKNQDYFVDGVTNDLITDLSHLSGLLVIASNSVFTYKGRAMKVQEVAKDLGVKFVLEGTIQRAGEWIRVNAQLIDARSGHHLWADRFDRELTDIFALQDEISQRIVTALAVELTPSEADRLSRSTTVDAEAYDLLLRGLEFLRRFTRETNAEAREYFMRAVAIDPGFARAHANIALTYALDLRFGWVDLDPDIVDEAQRYGRNALSIDPRLRHVHFALSSLYLVLKKHDEAIQAGREAVRIDPNYADGYATLAQALVYAGKSNEALEVMSTAKRLNPRYAFFYSWIEGHAHMMLRQYAEAISKFQEVIDRNAFFPGAHLTLAAIYGNIGPQDEAEWQAAEILAIQPDFSLKQEKERSPYRNREDLDWYINGLEAAGLPY